MRFGRIFLAGLAPLFALSALVAALGATQPSSPQKDFVRLLQAAVHFSPSHASRVPAAVSPARTSPQAVLQFAALSATPFGHSLWMVAGPVINLAAARPRRRALLRC